MELYAINKGNIVGNYIFYFLINQIGVLCSVENNDKICNSYNNSFII